MSYGMLCSGKELGIDDNWYDGASVDGILILDATAKIGQNIRDFLSLNEEVWDISITANMSHCQSVYGIARELSAHFKTSIKIPDITYVPRESRLKKFNVSIIAQDLCPRYIAHYVKNVKIEKSPVWMRRRLILAGHKPINNIVDITNYVLTELGQPMHAFDLSTIDSEIVIRTAKVNEKITVIDGKTLTLNNKNLLICDKTKPLALAGIMGGLDSSIKNYTKDIIFESANFKRENIRKSSRQLGISSDSSHRFEKGVDKYSTEIAINRALHLVQKLNCGEVTNQQYDITVKDNTEQTVIHTTFERINSVLGIKIPNDTIIEILERLNYNIDVNGNDIIAVPPKYREDVEDFPDLAEDIIKIYGYHHIKPNFLNNSKITVGGLNFNQKLENKIKECFVRQGYHEVINYSFYSENDLNMLELNDTNNDEIVKILNPISENYSIMRTTLVPSIANVLSHNMKVGNSSGRFFEFANIFKYANSKPLEQLHLCFGAYGKNENFLSFKGIVESIAERFNLKFSYRKNVDPFLHPYISSNIFCNNQYIGFIGQMSYKCKQNFELLENAFIGELDYEILKPYFKKIIKFSSIPKNPYITRDLDLIVDENIKYIDVENTIKEACNNVQKIELLDIYNGNQIGVGKKSVTFTIHFNVDNVENISKSIDIYIKKILNLLKNKLNIQIRS